MDMELGVWTVVKVQFLGLCDKLGARHSLLCLWGTAKEIIDANKVGFSVVRRRWKNHNRESGLSPDQWILVTFLLTESANI
jgi:hypothetical protein